MRKGLFVFLILIFLPVYASFGSLGQAQGYLLDAQNGAALAGGPLGAAQNTNVALVGQNQQSNNPYSFVTALQSENGMLVQGAYAVGADGLFGVNQHANVLGSQLQAPGVGGGLGIQNATLDGAFTQELIRAGGIGAAVGIQNFTGLQVQMIISPHGASANAQYLGLGIADGIGGGP
jgi:hypothetical protein